MIPFVFAALIGAAFAPTPARAAPRWSVIVYVGSDEPELASYEDPLVRELLAAELPAGVELLLQQDSASARRGANPDARYLRRPGERMVTEPLPEADSASWPVVEEFLRWAGSHATGERRLFVVATHSWGWKGLIQDYSVPGQGDADTMMPVRSFAGVLAATGFRADVILLDSCILGNVEPIEELKGAARYIVASERETPYHGFPMPELLRFLGAGEVSPRELARWLPENYVRPYIRGGALARPEGEYDVVTSAAYDLDRWDGFAGKFTGLVDALGSAGFRAKLAQNPRWPATFADGDSNVDLVELLRRLPGFVGDPAVASQAAALLTDLGYPPEAGPDQEPVGLDGAGGFELRLQGDEILEPSRALRQLRRRWREANSDLAAPPRLEFAIEDRGEGPARVRTLVVSGERPAEGFRFRPWLPGTRLAKVSWQGPRGGWHERSLAIDGDLVSVKDFPESSFLLAEAHAGGSPFIHGIGINLHPLMKNDEERSLDPLTGLAGPAFYRTTAWSRRTGWGALTLLGP